MNQPPLFDLPASAIDQDAVEHFLATCPTETLNIEFKRAVTKGVEESIAAMANTYGGMILLGIEDTTRAVIGIDANVGDQIINRCADRFEPPYTPEIVQVDFTERRTVLIIRVDPRRAPRPIVMAGKVWIRLERRNRGADRFRIASLFNESSTTALPTQYAGNWAPRHRHSMFQSVLAQDVHQDGLIVRSYLSITLAPELAPGRLVNTACREDLLRAAQQAPLTKWLSVHANKWGIKELRPWRWEGPTNSRLSTLRWSALVTKEISPVRGQLVMELVQAPSSVVPRIEFFLDVGLQPHHLTEPTPLRLDLAELYSLLREEVRTLCETVTAMVLPNFAGPAWQSTGPMIHVDAYSEPLSTYINLGHYPQVADRAIPGWNAVAPIRWPSDDEDTRRLVLEWLNELMLDAGYINFESGLDTLGS